MPDGPMPCPTELLPSLRQLANAVFRAEGGDMFREYPLVFDPQRPENMRVIVDGGRVVSHVGVCLRDASILGASLRVASIGAVSTLPQHRGLGYASALMQDAIERSREWGAQLMLISGGRGLYRRIGAIGSAQTERYELQPPEPGPDLALRRAAPADVALLARLYQREPVRFLRPTEDWEVLLRAEMLMNEPADCWLVLEDGEPEAYVAVQRPSPRRPPTVMEYAGSREAVWGALGLVAREYLARRLSLTLMPSDAALRAPLRRMGLQPRIEGFPGTVLVLDAAALLDRLSGLWSERVGASHLASLLVDADRDSITVRREGGTVRLTGAEVTVAFFGPEPGREPQVSPVPELPPLPMLWYGYNYV